MRDSGGAERSLPVPADPLDAALGPSGLHPPPPQAPHHEAASQREPEVPSQYDNMKI